MCIRDRDSTAHFFGAAAEAMRRILIDNARRKAAVRRGGEFRRVEFSNADLSLKMSAERAREIIRLTDSLEVFQEMYPVEASLVALRFFAGLTMEEAAGVINVNRRTAQRYWKFAKAALTKLMNEN